MIRDVDEIYTNDQIRSKCAEIYALNPDEGIDALRKALTHSDRAKISQALLEFIDDGIVVLWMTLTVLSSSIHV